MEKKIQKKLFVSEIIASELVALVVPIKTRILVIGTQCVNRQS